MKWANFLHIYQPPTQKEIWVRRIAEESYRKIFSGMLLIPEARISLNINGILCEFLEKFGGEDVLAMIKILAERGQVGLTGSAKFHPFLPLLPESEIERQIRLNEESLKKYFGDAFQRRGFFPPEMAYSAKVARVVRDMGYEWIIADQLAFPKGEKYKNDTVYEVREAPGLKIFFRDRSSSFAITSAQSDSAEKIATDTFNAKNPEAYVVSAMDGEVFGHHRPGLEQLFFTLLKDKRIDASTITDIARNVTKTEIISPRDSTWAVTEKDFRKNEPFYRWNGSDNPIQKAQWKLTDLALSVVSRHSLGSKERHLLDAALHSDQYWWASARPWWSLEMIERGAHEFKTIIQISDKADDEEKFKAEELYKNIIYTGFDWQRKGIVDELSRAEDEEARDLLEEKQKTTLTKEEYAHMIKNWEEQMRLAAKSEEYHRAATLKDRIRELKEEMKKAKE